MEKAYLKKQASKQTNKKHPEKSKMQITYPAWNEAWQDGVYAEYAASGASQVTAEHFWRVWLF